jgi:uncharacterized membrane protein
LQTAKIKSNDYIVWRKLKEILKKNLTPLIFCILYTAVFSITTILRYQTFHAAILDMGAEMHELFLISKGYFYFFNTHGSLSKTSVIASYFEILYFPLGFIYKIIPYVSFFLILQSFLIGISAFPFYYISKDLIGEKWGFIGPLLILLNPQIHTGNLFDFHVSVFYVTFISYALYFALKKNLFYLYLFSFLTLIVKVDSFLYVTSIAIFIFLLNYKKKHVIALLGLSWLYGMFTLFYIIPHLRNMSGLISLGNEKYTFMPILTAGINDIKNLNILGFINIIASTIFNNIRYNFKFLFYLLASLAFLPLFSKKYIAITIIPIMVCWLVAFYPNHFYYEPFFMLQYSYYTVPFFVLASIYGFQNILRYANKINLKVKSKYLALIFVVCILLTTLVIQNYGAIIDWSSFNVFSLQNYTYKKNMYQNTLMTALKKIKPQDYISSSQFIGSHLYNHYYLAIFPQGINISRYIVFSTCYFNQYRKKKDKKLLNIFNKLKSSGRYMIFYEKGCNTILKLR